MRAHRVAGLLVALLLTACGAEPTMSGDPSPEPRADHELLEEESAQGGTIRPYEWNLVGVTPDERTLLVQAFFGGVASDCNRFEGWEIAEEDDRVVIAARMWQNDAATACTDEGVSETMEVHLDEPLDGRELVGCRQADCRFGPLAHHLIGGGLVTADEDVIAAASMRQRGSVAPDGEVRWREAAGQAGLLLAGPGVLLDSHGVGDVVARDPETGDERWSAPGSPLGVASDTLIACLAEAGDDPGRPHRSVVAYGLDGGEPRWELTDTGCSRTLATDGTIAAFTDHGDGDGVRLLIVDVTEGRVVAEVTLEVDAGPVIGDPVLVDGEIVVAGYDLGVVAVDATTGEMRQVAEVEGRSIGGAAGLVLVATQDGVTAVDLADGEMRWQVDSHPEVPTVFAAGDALFTTTPDDGVLRRVAPDDGQPLWDAEVGRSAGIDVAVHDDVVYAATTTSLVALDLEQGEQLWWAALVDG